LDELSGLNFSKLLIDPLINVIIHFSQFRAAWRRVRGKEKPQTTQINETTVNQLSSSSVGYIECSFTNFDKRKKNQQKRQNHNLIHLKTMKVNTVDEPLSENNNAANEDDSGPFKSSTPNQNEIKYPDSRTFMFARDLRTNEKLELRMFSSEVNIYGKTINQIIRANSYKSNIC
jgi:hypothetical protein